MSSGKKMIRLSVDGAVAGWMNVNVIIGWMNKLDWPGKENKMTKDTELKPCPFCGGTQITIIITSPLLMGIPRKQSRLCLSCEARGPEKSTDFDINLAWNTRAKE